MTVHTVAPALKELPPLTSDAAARLTEFARACKAAVRAVTLYPSTHPAIGISLSRLAESADRMTAGGPATIGVLPSNLLLDGCGTPRPDQAVRETGALLHEHLIGILTLHSSPDRDGWLPFLRLLSQPIEEIRAGGGTSRVWAATGQRHLEIQEIDYADILRERNAGEQSTWDDIVRACLNLDAPLDDEALQQLLEVCSDPDKLAELIDALEKSEGAAFGSKASALIRMIRGVMDFVARTEPERLEPLLRSLAEGFGRLSPELLVELLSTERSRADAAADLVLGIVSRMTDRTIGGFVARAVAADGGASERLAMAFQALVPDEQRRPALLEIARSEARATPLGENPGFGELWQSAVDMLSSYSDAPFVSESYARELSGARAQALEVERVSDDPAERIGAWVTSIDPAEIRSLDLRLLLDLLALEGDPESWRKLTEPAVRHVEDLLLVGDFEGALQLVAALEHEAGAASARREPAAAALAKLVGGPMMEHITSHLNQVDAATVSHIERICHAVGPSVIKPLAEALAVEKRTGTRQRLTQVLLSFGAAGRPSVEQLKGSANPAVRRTAIHLLVQFGGSEALPDLTVLLDDAEPQIQREAVRAILMIGTEAAYVELQRALTTGTEKARESLIGALIALRSERAIPLFEHIVRNVSPKGSLRPVYLRAIESLGALHAEHTVELLERALYMREWWAPRRTAVLRRTAAAALLQIGTPEAQRVLENAVRLGSRSLRHAVRAVTETRGGVTR